MSIEESNIDRFPERFRFQLTQEEYDDLRFQNGTSSSEQYEKIEIKELKQSHDRFLLIDDKVYHLGASLKDLGKKWFAFSLMEEDSMMLMKKIKEVLDEK